MAKRLLERVCAMTMAFAVLALPQTAGGTLRAAPAAAACGGVTTRSYTTWRGGTVKGTYVWNCSQVSNQLGPECSGSDVSSGTGGFYYKSYPTFGQYWCNLRFTNGAQDWPRLNVYADGSSYGFDGG